MSGYLDSLVTETESSHYSLQLHYNVFYRLSTSMHIFYVTSSVNMTCIMG